MHAVAENFERSDTTVAKLKEWIASVSKETIELQLDTDLIRDGVLDSLQMVNFLLFIEELREQEIPEALIKPEYFASLGVIMETFFSG